MDIKYHRKAKKYAVSDSSKGLFMLFKIVGINQNKSTNINNTTDKIGLFVNIHKTIDNIQNTKEYQSDLLIFLSHFLKEINAIHRQKNETNQVLNAHNQASS